MSLNCALSEITRFCDVAIGIDDVTWAAAKIGARCVTRPVLMWCAKLSTVDEKAHAFTVTAVAPPLEPTNASTWIGESFFSWLIENGSVNTPVESVALVTLITYAPFQRGSGAGSAPETGAFAATASQAS